jgi:hypothetical protein
VLVADNGFRFTFDPADAVSLMKKLANVAGDGI